MTFFNGKVAIVTGGASGIGREIATQLTQAGAKVIVADLKPETLPENSPFEVVKLDVASAEAVKNLVAKVVAGYGRLDYMFNNAGFAITGEIAEMTIEQWERLIEVNLKGVVNGVMAAYPTMITQGNGHIINTASLAGISPTPVFGAYSTTKFAIVGLSRTLRIEAKKYGVKVTVLCPGFIKTAIYDNSVYINSQKDYLMKIIPVPVMDTEKAVRAMLKGIEKNKAMVVIPLYGKIQWWLDRLCQPLSAILGQKLIGDFRKKAKKL